MGEHEWKPGDVAMVTARWIRTDDHSERYAVRRPDGWWSRAGVRVGDWEVSAVRPLVVIDPEDREQVERLVGGLMNVNFWSVIPAEAEGITHRTGQMQAALREFADPRPPKLEEPTDLGAVVEDEEGVLWVRAGDSHGGRLSDNWRRVVTQGDDGWWSEWRNIAAVRVLSEGVQAGESA